MAPGPPFRSSRHRPAGPGPRSWSASNAGSHRRPAPARAGRAPGAAVMLATAAAEEFSEHRSAASVSRAGCRKRAATQPPSAPDLGAPAQRRPRVAAEPSQLRSEVIAPLSSPVPSGRSTCGPARSPGPPRERTRLRSRSATTRRAHLRYDRRRSEPRSSGRLPTIPPPGAGDKGDGAGTKSSVIRPPGAGRPAALGFPQKGMDLVHSTDRRPGPGHGRPACGSLLRCRTGTRRPTRLPADAGSSTGSCAIAAPAGSPSRNGRTRPSGSGWSRRSSRARASSPPVPRTCVGSLRGR